MSPGSESTMTVSSLRRAGVGDAPALAALRYRFRTVDYPGSGTVFEDRDAFAARCGAWMERQLAQAGSWHCWVVELADGTLGGQLWMQAIEKIPNPTVEHELLAYVTNVYVLPELRGQGLASRLLDLALAWCRTHDVDQAILWPSPKSRALYARHGFAASDATMIAPIHPGH